MERVRPPATTRLCPSRSPAFLHHTMRHPRPYHDRNASSRSARTAGWSNASPRSDRHGAQRSPSPHRRGASPRPCAAPPFLTRQRRGKPGCCVPLQCRIARAMDGPLHRAAVRSTAVALGVASLVARKRRGPAVAVRRCLTASRVHVQRRSRAARPAFPLLRRLASPRFGFVVASPSLCKALVIPNVWPHDSIIQCNARGRAAFSKGSTSFWPYDKSMCWVQRFLPEVSAPPRLPGPSAV